MEASPLHTTRCKSKPPIREYFPAFRPLDFVLVARIFPSIVIGGSLLVHTITTHFRVPRRCRLPCVYERCVTNPNRPNGAIRGLTTRGHTGARMPVCPVSSISLSQSAGYDAVIGAPLPLFKRCATSIAEEETHGKKKRLRDQTLIYRSVRFSRPLPDL